MVEIFLSCGRGPTLGAFGHLGRLPGSVKNAPGAFGAFEHIFDSIFRADFRVHLGIYAQNRLK